MATRLYLAASGAAPLTTLPLAGPAWGVTGDLVRLPMYSSPSGTALATRTLAWAAGTTANWVWWQFQSPPISRPSLLGGTNRLIIGQCAETTTNGDTSLLYHLWLASPSGENKGVLSSMFVGGTEFPLVASAATRSRGPLTTTPTPADAGDRVILEVGVSGTTPAIENIQMRIGDPTAIADFAFTEDLTTDLLPWLEFSGEIEFGDAYYDFLFVNSVAGGTALNVRPVQSSADVALTVGAGQIIPIKSRLKSSLAAAVGLLP